MEKVPQVYAVGEKTSKYDISKRFNAIKKEDYPYVLEVSKWAVQMGVQDAWTAYERFWKKISKGHPKFKKKGKSRDSFYLGGDSLKVNRRKVKIPLLSSTIRMAQEIRFPGKITSVTIGKDNNKWYASFSVEVDETYKYPHTCENQAVCGIDMGLTNLMIVSDGTVFSNPKYLKQHERKLKRLQKSLSRKKKGSNRREKAKRLLSRQQEKVKNLRRDYQHKCTSGLVRKYKYLGLETLNVKGLLKNHNLAKGIQDAGWGEIRRQFTYKTLLSGSCIILADQFYPSSKLCSVCGKKNQNLVLGITDWVCSSCKITHDRDLNAAYNLKNLARRYRESLNTRGEDVSLETLCSQQPLRNEKLASTVSAVV